MGLRGINPLAFSSFVGNQVDPNLNFGNRPAAPRTTTNDAESSASETERADQVAITELSGAVPGVQAEETRIDESQTQLDSSRLRQEVGLDERGEAGRFLDIIS